MRDVEELSRKVIYYRAMNKISAEDLAAKLEISYGTLLKIIRKQNVKETTRIYVWEKLEIIEKLEKEGE